MKLIMYGSMLLLFLLCAVISAITPYITRKTESFGIAIPHDFYHDPQLVRFRKQYVKYNVLIGIATAIVLGALIGPLTENQWSIAYLIAIFSYFLVSFFIYYHFHKKMRAIKEKARWYEERKEMITIDTKFYQEKLVYSHKWFIIPLLITLVTIGLTLLYYDHFPERIPMQYDLQGNVTRWADKSLGTVLTMPLLQLFMTGLFLFINIVIAKSKQQLDPARPEESRRQNIIFRRRWSMFTIISGTIMVALFSLAQLSFVVSFNSTFLFTLTMGITFIIILGALFLTLTTGQGGSRLKTVEGKNGKIINRDDDKYWKLGIFYFNPDDPAIFVEKRFGSGWTNNFAQPLTWVLLIGLFAIILFITLLIP